MVKQRHFKYLADYNNVYEMLVKNYKPQNAGGNMLPAEFEYSFCHPFADIKAMSKSGVWEENSNIVACAHIEFELGEVFFEVAESYSYLYEEMLDFSEKYLYGTKEDGTKFLSIKIPMSQVNFKEYAENKGYQFSWKCECYRKSLDKQFEVKLPEGYHIIRVYDGIDYEQLHIAIQLGFDHKIEEIVGDHVANSLICASGPHFDPKMNYVVVAPNGDYAAYGGFWYEERIDLAYLEPLCTHPSYRGKGLAKAILYQGMNACKNLGAKYCTGGEDDFYSHLGFEKYTSYSWMYKEI